MFCLSFTKFVYYMHLILSMCSAIPSGPVDGGFRVIGPVYGGFRVIGPVYGGFRVIGPVMGYWASIWWVQGYSKDWVFVGHNAVNPLKLRSSLGYLN